MPADSATICNRTSLQGGTAKGWTDPLLLRGIQAKALGFVLSRPRCTFAVAAELRDTRECPNILFFSCFTLQVGAAGGQVHV
jgi:hypothetical protein